LALLWPLAVLMLVMGLAPSLWLPQIEQGIHLPQLSRSSVPPVPIRALNDIYVSPNSYQGEGQR
jgi:hypothetical protein